MDADKWTDQELVRIEKELDSIYSKANEELLKKSKDYFDQFKKDDEVYKKMVESGDMSKSTYYRWRKKTLTQGNQYKDLQKQSAFEMSRTNERAMAYVNGRLPKVYVQNYNAIKTDVEGIGGYSFTLVNEDAVKYVYKNIDKTLLPIKHVDRAKDVAWNMKRINSEVLQGIIQGESMDKVAGRLQKAGISNEKAAIRNARTMVTGAQNHGKLDSYYRLRDDGIDIKKRWDATLDKRTREAHGELDGQTAEIEEPFTNSIGDIMYPGDPDADPANVYNCRCSLQGDVGQTRGAQRATRDEKGRSVLTENMTYQEWYESRTGKKFEVKPKEIELPKSEVRSMLEKFNVEYLEPKELDKKLTSMEIAEKLAGGDMTKGSCASLSMAYAANVGGQDVRDFRGGNSMAFFSKSGNLNKIANLTGVEGYVVSDYNDFKVANELLKNVVEGKEYAFGVGKHMAIIRKTENGFEYLEMQSAKETGFKKLTNDVLRWRFGCQRSHSTYGMKYKLSGELIEVESLGKNSEFKKMTGYINTLAENQMKGALGGLK